MAHMQQQILDALQARLAAGETTAGADVFVDRLDPLPKGKRAAILISEGDNGDSVEPGTIADVQKRTLDIEIACVLKACADVAAEAREFGLTVEKLLSPRAATGNAAIRAACKDWRIVSSRPVQSGEGEEAVASRVQLWQFTYYVRKGSPDVAI